MDSWFTKDAIYSDDFSFHYGNTLERNIYLKQFGQVWGYDPYIRAGSITNAFLTIDNNGWSIFSCLLFFLPVGVSFKLFFILSLLTIPLLCYCSARNFFLPPQTALIAAIAGTLLTHISAMVNFLQWGSGSFVFVCYISLYTASSFYRFCITKKPGPLIRATAAMTCAIWIHAFAVVILFMPLLMCYALFFRKLGMRQHIWVMSALTVSFLMNLPWMLPFLTFKDQIVRDNSSIFYSARSVLEPIYTYFLRKNLFNSYMNMVFHKEEWVDIFLLLAGLLGMGCWFKNKQKKLSIIFFTSFVFLFVFSYYGSFYKATQITPMRFLLSLNTFLLIPTAGGIIYLYRLFLADKPAKVHIISLAALGYLLVALIATPYYHLFYKKDFHLVYSIPEPFQDLVSWINNNTTKEGRILIENSDFGTDHQYYGTHLPFILPHLTGREYLGNYSYFAVAKDYIATFNEGYLFRKPVGDISDKMLREYFDLYNIRWVIYWSENSKKVFGRDNPFFTPLIKIDKFNICRVERKPSFFIKGSGTVQADYNRIQLSNVKPVGGEIILCYHFMKFLKTDPPLPIERVMLSDDKVGFIRIKNPPPSLLIYNGY